MAPTTFFCRIIFREKNWNLFCSSPKKINRVLNLNSQYIGQHHLRYIHSNRTFHDLICCSTLNKLVYWNNPWSYSMLWLHKVGIFKSVIVHSVYRWLWQWDGLICCSALNKLVYWNNTWSYSMLQALVA